MASRYEKEDSKRRILSACVQLFLEKGYQKTTTVEILKKAGVTKNFTPNYLDGLSPSAYADLYTKIHISPKITNYRLE